MFKTILLTLVLAGPTPVQRYWGQNDPKLLAAIEESTDPLLLAIIIKEDRPDAQVPDISKMSERLRKYDMLCWTGVEARYTGYLTGACKSDDSAVKARAQHKVDVYLKWTTNGPTRLRWW